jgi:hypothetical protein
MLRTFLDRLSEARVLVGAPGVLAFPNQRVAA